MHSHFVLVFSAVHIACYEALIPFDLEPGTIFYKLGSGVLLAIWGHNTELLEYFVSVYAESVATQEEVIIERLNNLVIKRREDEVAIVEGYLMLDLLVNGLDDIEEIVNCEEDLFVYGGII